MSHDTAGAKTGIVLKENLCDLSKNQILCVGVGNLIRAL